jgi:hypothetical protein
MILRSGLFALAAAAWAAGADWESLCNGRDLSGWKVECRENDRSKPFWKLRDGAIECDTAGDRKHDYVWLVSEKEFGDFEFECLVQTFAGSPGNSGIQIRSRFVEDGREGPWMHGPQVDIHPPDPWRSGLIYDETRETRRWIFPPLTGSGITPADGPAEWAWIHSDGSMKKRKADDQDPSVPGYAFRGKWNHVRIVARGPRIETEINGHPISRFDGSGILDDEAHRLHQVGLRGKIALQLHSGDDLKIRFKDLRIRVLDPPEEAPLVTVVRDDDGLRKAAAALRPGSILRLAPGNYRPGVNVRDARGTPDAPIVIEGLDPRSPPVFQGGSQAWHLSRVSHLTLRWMHFRGQQHNGINVDDGGTQATPSHDVNLSHLHVEDTGPNGNFDGIKCSGVERLRILDCRIAGWGGQAIDFVGCRNSEIARCEIIGKPGFSQHTGPQFKGGSSDVWIHHCLLQNAGQRPIQAGGSTGLDYFRPLGAPYEARRIRIEDNRIIGGDCAVAFTGADDCDFSHNTIVRPDKWVFRILQESRGERFVRCGDNRISNNLIVFERAKVRDIANIGPDTRPETFGFHGNHWFAQDAPESSRPKLPAKETDGVHGIDPKLDPASHIPGQALPAGMRKAGD